MNIKLAVIIRENSTQTNALYYMDDETDAHGWWNPFSWKEGNFSCDCNRHLFFTEAMTGKRDWNIIIPCGEILYSVLILDPVSGEILYKDETW